MESSLCGGLKDQIAESWTLGTATMRCFSMPRSEDHQEYSRLHHGSVGRVLTRQHLTWDDLRVRRFRCPGGATDAACSTAAGITRGETKGHEHPGLPEKHERRLFPVQDSSSTAPTPVSNSHPVFALSLWGFCASAIGSDPAARRVAI